MKLLNSGVVLKIYDELINDDYYKYKFEDYDINNPKDLYDYIVATINSNLEYDMRFSIPIDEYEDPNQSMKLSSNAKVQNVRLKNINDEEDLNKYRIDQHDFLMITEDDDGCFWLDVFDDKPEHIDIINQMIEDNIVEDIIPYEPDENELLPKKFYELESEYFNRRERIENEIEYYEDNNDEPLTLKELLKFGLNNIHIHTTDGFVISGYEVEDFDEKYLDMRLKNPIFYEDNDGYTVIRVDEDREVEKNSPASDKGER